MPDFANGIELEGLPGAANPSPPPPEVKDEESHTSSRHTVIHNPDAEHRVIFLNVPQPIKYCSNRISTGKYNALTFLPLFLFEQFRRWANLFFLLIALMQQIPDVSPTGRYTTLVPLLFILSVSALKEIVEDMKRHKADEETNNRVVEVLRDGVWISMAWHSVLVGDIVKVVSNKFFPADLVIITTSEPQGMAFIETSNLDGETNLKIRQALPVTVKCIEPAEIVAMSGTLECEHPNRHLYEFNGVLKLTNKTACPVGPDQVLLRGAMLRNTAWVFGLVVYTGDDSKLMRNTTSAPLKRSTVDKLTNTQVLMLFFILIFMCIVSAVCNEVWNNNYSDQHWYIGLTSSLNTNFAFNLLTFIILYNNLIPISLQVTLEVVRFIQAIFINMDIKMYYEENDTPAMARTSNLNEELGQVKYIFTDKTGTLTRNIMEFKKCAIAGNIYPVGDNLEETLLIQHLRSGIHSKFIAEFLVLMAVCHTVIPERHENGEIFYHAASPDEQALVSGARKFGYVFLARTPEYVEIEALGEKQRFDILHVIEFTSTRKRMSVIVRDPEGKLKLLCKGADTVIYERLADHKSCRCSYADTLLQQLEAFALEGLRTLCCAVCVLNHVEYEEWRQKYHEAVTSIRNREKNVEEVAELIERNLFLLGATAIEDKLQDGVPDAVASLLRAGINIWVLTGDKQETAINIGYSCKLLSHGMQLIIVNSHSLDTTREVIQRHVADLGEMLRKPNEIGLIVDGKTLKYALSHELQREFLDLALSCKVVVCCRVSPMQKAEVVDLVKRNTKDITLAIGDGANDVAMIQKAHVGVGISGQEGLQASCASDYSIAQFRFLARLLLVHGAWNYARITKLILYSFYKNICLYVVELWFAIYSAWSGQILFERWTIGLYNVIFTALPPLAMGLFDKTCSADLMLKYPQLYRPSQTGMLFNVRVFWVWIINALIHSIILFWMTYCICYFGIMWSNGKEGGYLLMGNFVYSFVVVVVCLKAGLVTNSWTCLTHLAIWGSIIFWFIFLIIYSHVWPTIDMGSMMVGMDVMVLSSAPFWIGMLVVSVASMAPDVAVKAIKSTAFKSLMDMVRELEIRKSDPAPVFDQDRKNSLSERARLLHNVRNVFTRRSQAKTVEQVELQHGYAFSQEEGGAVTQTEVIRAYNTNLPKP